MFADAIEQVRNFTRLARSISRVYNSTTVTPGAATFFFVNEDGWAITCKHVAELIIAEKSINDNYEQFKKERSELPLDENHEAAMQHLEQKFDYQSNTIIQIKHDFSYSVSEIKLVSSHIDYDLAILHFKSYVEKYYHNHAVFAKNSNLARPGTFLCRLGYPFPEYSDYRYDEPTDDIMWNKGGNANTPLFPIEGMFTRHVGGVNGEIMGIELSTPGLRGQSGGPLFDTNGIVFGMQSATEHLYLNFDIKDAKIPKAGKIEIVNNQPFLHVGRCIHVDIIKKFLDENNVKYYVGDSLDKEEVVNA